MSIFLFVWFAVILLCSFVISRWLVGFWKEKVQADGFECLASRMGQRS